MHTYTTTEFERLSQRDIYYLCHNLRYRLSLEEQANWRLVQHQLAHLAWRAWDESASAMGAERARAKERTGR